MINRCCNSLNKDVRDIKTYVKLHKLSFILVKKLHQAWNNEIRVNHMAIELNKDPGGTRDDNGVRCTSIIMVIVILVCWEYARLSIANHWHYHLRACLLGNKSRPLSHALTLKEAWRSWNGTKRIGDFDMDWDDTIVYYLDLIRFTEFPTSRNVRYLIQL